MVKYQLNSFDIMTGGRGASVNQRRVIALSLVLLLILIIITIPVAIQVNNDDDINSEDKINEISDETLNERSIFYGREPGEIANIIGKAVRNTTYESSMIESQCGGCIWMDYYFGNDDHLNIRYSEYGDGEFLYDWIYFAKSGYEDNEGNWNEEYAIGHMTEVLTRFLEPFNILNSSDYQMKIIPWGYMDAAWKITVVQILNGFEVDGTGFEAHVGRENGEIRTMTIKDWVFPEYEFNKIISIEQGKEIIYSELEVVDFNLSYSVQFTETDPITGNSTSISASLFKIFNISLNQVEYAGPAIIDGHLCHRFDVELIENMTTVAEYSFYLETESGLILKWQENRNGNGRSMTLIGNLIGEGIKWSDRLSQFG
jgi:hypothetical protein